MALDATVRVTGLSENGNMFFVMEQMIRTGPDHWVVNKTYNIFLDGIRNKISDGIVQCMVKYIMPGMYRIRQFKKDGNIPWAWSYIITAPESGEIT